MVLLLLLMKAIRNKKFLTHFVSIQLVSSLKRILDCGKGIELLITL